MSQLISILEDVKKSEGDGYIWSVEDLDFPCPSDFLIEMTETLKRTDCGLSGGSKELKLIQVDVEYEDGLDVVDRSMFDITKY